MGRRMGRRDGSRGAWVLRLLLVASLAAAVALTGQSQAGADDDGDGSSIELDTAWGTDGVVTGPGPNDRFYEPIGVAVGRNGNVYVADSDNNRIVKLDPEGELDTDWGTGGIVSGSETDAGEFSYPEGIAVGPNGNVYVADSGNNRIVKLDRDGELAAEWGAFGSKDQFSYPSGVAVGPNGNVYVSDSSNSRIVKFDSEGELDTEWGEYGHGDGEFNWPGVVAVGPNGNVYVADYGNNRIVKLDRDGELAAVWGAFRSGDQFSYPNGVAVGPNGNVYVADYGNNRIVKLDPEGELDTEWGTDGIVSGPGPDDRFSYPEGVAVGPNGNVYVADTYNNRIVKFRDTSAPVSAVGKGSGGDCSDQAAFMAMIEDEGVGVDFGKVIDCAVLNQESLVKPGQLEQVRIEPQGRAGLSDNVKIKFKTTNPVPKWGKVVVTLPEGFVVGSKTRFDSTAVGFGAVVIDPSTTVTTRPLSAIEIAFNDEGAVRDWDAANVESRDIPARSVTAVFYTQIEPGDLVVLMLTDIKHPAVSGPPTEGGSVETQNSTGAPIDSCLHGNDACIIGYTDVKPGFVTGLVFDLDNEELHRADDDLLHTAAGSTGEIFVSFRTTNFVSMNDKVVVTFPEGFVVGPDAIVSDGYVTSSEGRTVDIALWEEIQPGELVTLKLSDITNPPFTGDPQGGRIVTWDHRGLFKIDESIDNEDDYDEACEAQVIDCEGPFNWDQVTVDRITPGKLTDNEVMLDNKKAGGTGPVTVTFTLDNPLPRDGAIAVTFPKGFVLNSGGNTTKANFINPAEGTVEVVVYVVDEETTAVFFRNGSGDELKPEEREPVIVQLTNIRNPQVSGLTNNFEIRTSVGK